MIINIERLKNCSILGGGEGGGGRMAQCLVCERLTYYRDSSLRVLCSPLCQYFNTINLSGKPSFIDEDEDEVWSTLEDTINFLYTEDNEELKQLLGQFFVDRFALIEARIDYFHELLQERKNLLLLDSINRQIEETNKNFHKSDNLADLTLFTNIEETESYFRNYKFAIEETKSIIISLKEKKEVVLELWNKSTTRIREKSLIIKRDTNSDFRLENEEILMKIAELEVTKHDLITLFSNLPFLEIILNEEISITEEESGDDDEEVKRIEVVTGMTQEQLDVFQSVEDKIKLHEDLGMKGKVVLDFVKDYIVGCDVIMHVPLNTILDVMNDTDDIYIRNLFEVGRGGGSLDKVERSGWESKIFDSEEYDQFKPHEKVKYGTVNLNRTKGGVRSLWKYYGKSYLILNNDVKSRCTYARNDSSSLSVTGPHDLGTTRFMANLSTKFHEDERRNMERRGNGKKKWIADDDVLRYPFSDYMEVQIHGELTFKRDVAMIMIDRDIYDEGLKGSLKTLFQNIGKKIAYEIF